MTIINRRHVPLDQTELFFGETYCCWQIPEFASDWQVSLGGIVMGKNADWCITKVDGVGLPNVRSTDIDNAFLHGTSALGDFAESRTINIDFSAKFASPQAGWDAVRQLAGAWQATVSDQPLRFRMTGDKTLFLIGHPRRLDVNTDAMYRGVVSGSAQFVADDPRFYHSQVTRQATNINIALESDGFCFDPNAFCLDPEVCIPVGETGIIYAENIGNTKVPPIIVVSGDLQDVTISNINTGEWFQWEGDVGNGELWVDALSRTAKLDGVERYDEIAVGSKFFWLAAGQNRLNVTAATGTGQAEVRFRSAWF